MGTYISNSRINKLCIYIVFVLVNISYCPGIILTPNYHIVMSVITILLITGIVVSAKNNFPFIAHIFLTTIFITLAYSVIVYGLSGYFVLNAYYNLFIVITCITLGYTATKHSRSDLYRIFVIYILAALFLGLYSILTNLGGFKITKLYVFSVKNSSSVLLATAQILCLYLIKDAKTTFKQILWITIWIILFVCTMTFRSRTCMLGVIIATSIFLIKSKVNITKLVFSRTFLLSVFIVFVTTAIINIDISQYIYDAMFANKDTDDMNSMTSGRIEIFQFGWDFFKRHPILGNLSVGRELPPIDNFILSQLVYFGVVGSLLNFIAYIAAWLYCIKGLITSHLEESYPYLTLFLLCLVSFTEGPFPFGPGTPVICTWFLIGWAYRNQSNREAICTS